MSQNGQNYHYRLFLEEELLTRKTRNAAYSQRAFARDLGVTQPLLSAVLAGKKNLSKEQVKNIIDKLNVPEDVKTALIQSFLWEWWEKQRRQEP